MSALFDVVTSHNYWSSAGFTQWNATRWRLFRAPSVPIYVGECGRDRVRDGPNGTYLPTGPGPAFGWQAQGLDGDQYLAELAAYDAELRRDGVFGVVFTGSPDDLWARLGFSTDEIADRCHGFTNLGPHDLMGSSPQSLAWAAVAPIVKSCDQTAAIRRARPDAITIYRRRFSPAEQDDILARTDAAHLVGAIVEGLAGFRHPRLHVELLNEIGKGQRLQYEALAKVAVPQLRAIGLKVAGPSWATGDYEEIDWATFALGGGPTVPDIVLNVPMRTSLAAPENYSAGPRARTIGVVIHTTRGGASTVEREYIATINWFQNPAAQVSAHLVVGAGSFAEVCRSVHDDDVAWHCREANATHLGIEIAQQEPTSPITDFQYVAAADACRKWAAKYHIPLVRVMSQTVPGIVGHQDTEAGRRDGKTDPGVMWDWDRFMRLVQGGTPVPPTPTPPTFDRAAEWELLWKKADEWEKAGYPWMGQGLKSLVAKDKGEK